MFAQQNRHFCLNNDLPLSEWLEVEKIFKPGKQGIVGLVRSKKDKDCLYVFKVTQGINYLINHEKATMEALKSLTDYCPHFCRLFGTVSAFVDPCNQKDDNPFDCDNSRYKIEKDVLLTEYLVKSKKFCRYIYSDVSEDILYSTIKQVLLALAIAQKEKRFTHYDLHSNNVMMKKCSRNLVFLYVLDEKSQFCVPTRGYYPVIIDYGFSYAGDMDSGYLWQSLNHTDIGFLSDRFDPIADPKLFLVTVSDEIRRARKSKQSRKLRNIVKNNFSSLPIDWDSGWDNDSKDCATDLLLRKLEKYTKLSPLFREYEYYCIDLIQSLIILPLEDQKKDNLELSFVTFLTEFIKLETQIGNPFFCLCLLKAIVDSARQVHVDYLKSQTREQAVKTFRNDISSIMSSLVNYCQLKDIDFEKMLCGLLCSVKGIEGYFYRSIEKRALEKDRQYRKVPLTTPEELALTIDVCLPEKYTFSTDTRVVVIDNIKKCTYPFELTEEQSDHLNNFTSVSWGTEMYNFLILSNNKKCPVAEDYLKEPFQTRKTPGVDEAI